MKDKRNIFFIMIVVLLAIFLGNRKTSNTITVSGGVTSESQIIGNIIMELINEETEYKTEFLNNLATANINQVAMEKNELDISSVRYTGTDLIGQLSLPPENDPDKALEIVQNEFKKRYDMLWLPSYGFSNQFAFMVTKETAEELGLEKVSDLRPYAKDITLGADQPWVVREGDGYEGFKEAYDMEFKDVKSMQVALLYDAVEAKNLDVILGYSTDGRVGYYELVMLEDDLNFFPPYTCSMVIPNRLVEEYPDLLDILLRLEDKIDTEKMQELNFMADNLYIEPNVIAKEFLEENNYFRTK